MLLTYKDTATFIRVTSTGYRGSKLAVEQAQVPVIFLQNTGFINSNYQENYDADAICYPDPLDIFIDANHNRLEGLYILAPLFGINDDDAWYKVTEVRVNRDHLLGNQIDNIELLLKKTAKIAGVS